MKFLGLVSGGIDSPVALHLFLKEGFKVEGVVFENSPFSNPHELKNALNTIKVVGKKHGVGIRTHIVPLGRIQEEFLNKVNKHEVKYNCIFSRRIMLRISEKIAKEINAHGLITGDCLGQVASQTLENLVLIGSAVSIPILRPLLGLDKEEIITMGKEIGTYEVSILGGIACAVNLEYPETHGKAEEIEKIECKVNLKELIKKALKERKVIEL